MKHILVAILCIICSGYLHAKKKADALRIMCYNTENFFDCEHDSLKNDQDFTPEGLYHWTPYKFKKKQINVAQVIISIGRHNMPALVGLCEIENDKVLRELTQNSALKNKYKYIHQESPDLRGVDVALLYLPCKFTPIKKEFIQINFPNDPATKTRDILYTTGILANGNTLHVFVCHFPSRYKKESSDDKRIYVASVLRGKVDSIYRQSPKADILIMGDFNNNPTDKSISGTLKALTPEGEIKPGNLYNLYYNYQGKSNIGTYKYKGQWSLFDQIIVSGNILSPSSKTFANKNKAKIYSPGFLLDDDIKYGGTKPFRTYKGLKYNDGYSDHLPVYLDIITKKK
ncbi:MAG: endonuclease [Paludibacteraceae bacterium]|nr:endonuclease [Paludibacteraceae bacterium]